MATKNWIIAMFMLVLSYFMPSCALLDRYKSNQHAIYHKTLTEVHKTEIAKFDSIELQYYGGFENHTEKGTLLVTKHNKRNKYNFVERGLWKEVPFEYLDTTENLIISRTKRYDQYGNLREKETYASFRGGKGVHRNDVWISEIKAIDGDTILVQHIKNYFTDGQVSHQLSVAIPEYKKMRSDYLKTKYKVGWEYEYDRDGSVTDSTMYELSDGVTKQNYF